MDDDRPDVLLTGLLFYDLVLTGLGKAPTPGEEIWTAGMGCGPGGIANLAVAASRLGLRTSLATVFGDDFYGEYCRDILCDQEDIDTRRVVELDIDAGVLAQQPGHGRVPGGMPRTVGRHATRDMAASRGRRRGRRSATPSGPRAAARASHGRRRVRARVRHDPRERGEARARARAGSGRPARADRRPNRGGSLPPVTDHAPVELHIISDSTGETAARLVLALEAQFPEQDFVEIRHPRIESEDDLQLAVNRILRFESLEKDFGSLMLELQMDTRLPHVKVSNRKSYREYYDDTTAEIVADAFAPDLEQFGYEL